MNPLGVVDGDADRYETPSECPIPLERSGSSRGAMEEEAVVTTDDEDEFLVGRCIPCPGEPSPEMVARHNLTHLPYQSWCPHCVASRKNNQAHQEGKSAPRSLPLLVLDYCFLGESGSQDQLTVLVGRIYPARALFATVVQHKSAFDLETVGRFSNFLRSTGATDIVYKTDQEHAAVALIREVVRASKIPGHPNFGVLQSAVPETSAVGQSQSNARAERSVQQFEDLARCYKSALEARMKCKLDIAHPLMKWLCEHVANTYNKQVITPTGKTPYATLHGKNPREKLVEFGERFLWHVPTLLRKKMDLR